MFKFDSGLAVPASDVECVPVIKEQVRDIDLVLGYCRSRNVVVQAGGNVGLWPNYLSKLFKTVYTFEPDSQNFCCLAWNTRLKENIIRMQAALGDKPTMVGMERFPENVGKHTVNGPGIFPMMTIDSLGLQECDLIYLDIEGHEPQALFGARSTLARFHPVISLEDNGLADQALLVESYAMLSRMGYKHVATVHRDKVFAC
jgi:FkbM family methyltransferase